MARDNNGEGSVVTCDVCVYTRPHPIHSRLATLVYRLKIARQQQSLTYYLHRKSVFPPVETNY
jgi:hypothetical protein